MANKAARLAELYALVPKIPDCKRTCWRSCGPVVQLGILSPYEASRLRNVEHTEREDLSTCVLLTEDNLCRAYEMRPFICRLWGTVPRMACPEGCQPERWLTNDETMDLLNRVTALSGAQIFAYGEDTEAALRAIAEANKAWEVKGRI